MGSFQFFCEDIKGKIVSSPHYLKFLIKLPNQTWPSATASNLIWGQTLKSHFVPIWVLTTDIEHWFFFKKSCIIFAKLRYLLANPTDLAQAKILLITLSSCFQKSQSSVPIGKDTYRMLQTIQMKLILLCVWQSRPFWAALKLL